MKQIITKDNSVTLHNREYDETYHSVTGAMEETFEKFIKPCKIKELAEKGKLRILDICFGLGYNAIAAIETALESNPNCEIEIVSLEQDLKLDELKKLNPKLKHYSIIKKLELDPINNQYIYEDKNIHLIIKLGDAVETIRKVTGKFDAVFLDPFSPKKNSELWTYSFFSEIANRMKKQGILATYSCARMVRDNLVKAGFTVKDGPKVGRRGPSTIATLSS